MRMMMMTAIALSATGALGDEPAWPDVGGRWARAQITTTLVDVPILGETSVRTLAITMLEVRQDGADLELAEQVCALESEAVKKMVETRYPPRFVRAVSGGERRARLVRDDGAIRWVEPYSERTIGAGDEDGDGHPGVTVQIDGLVRGDVYVRQRGWQSAAGELIQRGRIAGSVRFGVEQVVLGATDRVLENVLPTRPHPDPDRNLFRMVKVPEGAGCDDVLRRRSRLFGL